MEDYPIRLPASEAASGAIALMVCPPVVRFGGPTFAQTFDCEIVNLGGAAGSARYDMAPADANVAIVRGGSALGPVPGPVGSIAPGGAHTLTFTAIRQSQPAGGRAEHHAVHSGSAFHHAAGTLWMGLREGRSYVAFADDALQLADRSVTLTGRFTNGIASEGCISLPSPEFDRTYIVSVAGSLLHIEDLTSGAVSEGPVDSSATFIASSPLDESFAGAWLDRETLGGVTAA